MPYPATLTDTELSAVNSILAAVGQAPIQTLDQTNPDTDIVYNTLVEINRSTQAEGWNFNTEYEYPLTPDVNGYILIADNMLSVDLSDLPENMGYEVTTRNGRLYNKVDHTDVWSTDREWKCDIVWLYNFVDTPQVFKDFVIARSAVQAAVRMIGDKDQYVLLQQREREAKAALLEYDCNQGDYSMFGFPQGLNYYSAYQPFQTLRR